MFQHSIRLALDGYDDKRNISDDIIVSATTKQAHERLRNVFERLSRKGFKLKKEKFRFDMDKMTFMGYVLSAEGISPEESKVEAFTSASNPSNASEVRSFLVLVNYFGRVCRIS